MMVLGIVLRDVLSTFGESIILARLPINRGAGAARNHGASLARGEYSGFSGRR